jgi:predicted NAD/FAD-binding protein
MSFGVSIDGGRFEYSGSDSYGTLFAQKSNLLRPGFHKMLVDIIRFNNAAVRYLATDGAAWDGEDEPTLGAFLDQGRYGRFFCERYLLPMSAAIWSASLEGMRAFPARSFFRFFDNHGLLTMNDRPAWRTISGGSTVYVEKLTTEFRGQIRTGAAVERIIRDGEQVWIDDATGDRQPFDVAVLACHADQALAIIDRPSSAEIEVLGAFDYQTNRTILHSDASLMPKRRAVWSSWNYLTSSARSNDVEVSVTYWLNHLQSLKPEPLALVSLNPLFEPDPDRVAAELSYDHPQFSRRTLEAQSRLHDIQGRDRLWFAGAHWGQGFHEDGLLSGLQVAAALGVAPPWWPNVEPLRPVHDHTIEPLPASAAAGAD